MQNEIMAIARQLHVEYDFYFEKTGDGFIY